MAAVAQQTFSLRQFLFGSTPHGWESSPFAAVGPLAQKRRELEAARANLSAMSPIPLLGMAGAELSRRIGLTKAVENVGAFFRDNLITPVRRTFAGNGATVVAKDRLSGAAIPIAAARPEQRQALLEAATRGRDPAADAAAALSAQAGNEFKAKLGKMFVGVRPGDPPPFRDWDDLSWTLSNSLPGHNVTVRNGELWIGTEVGVSGATPDETKSLLSKRKREIDGAQSDPTEGVRRPARFLYSDSAPRTPVLLDDHKLRRASEVFAQLDLGRMTKHFSEVAERGLAKGNARLAEATRKGDMPGVRAAEQDIVLAQQAISKASFGEWAADRAKRQSPGLGALPPGLPPELAQARAAGPAQVARRRAPEEVPATTGFGFGGVALPKAQGPTTISPATIVVQIDDDGKVAGFYNTLIKRNATGVTDPRQLPPGDYRKEQFGMPTGFLRVGENQALSHLDLGGRPHREGGAYYEPAPGSDERARYALDGEEISSSDFAAEMRRRRQAEALPDPSFGSADESFGGAQRQIEPG